jgi:hypothetical protein
MVTTFQRTRSAVRVVVVASAIESPPSSGRQAFVDLVLLFEDPLQVYEARCVGSRVETAAPGRLAPSFLIAVARIAAGGAFAFEDEVAPAKFARGVKAGARRVVVSSAHDAPPVSVLLGGWSDERSAVGPIDRARARAATLHR